MERINALGWYRMLLDIVVSLKNDIERSSLNRNDFSQMDAVLHLSPKLERIRFFIRTIRPNSKAPIHPKSADIIKRIIYDVEQIQNDKIFIELYSRSPYRNIGPRESDGIIPIFNDDNRVPTKSDALEYIASEFRIVMDELPLQLDLDGGDGARELRRIVPEQQRIAPVQFDFVEDRLVIVHSTATAKKNDAANAQSAREALIESGKRIIDNLQNSNCDKRLLQTVEALQEKLVRGQDVIQLGIMNIGCEALTSVFSQELPNAVLGMLKAQTASVGLYVAQFEEWSRFAANAAAVELTPDDISQVSNVAARLVDELSKTPSAVDPEVPKTIAMLRALILEPGKATKRAAFAVIRTIENLIAKIFTYGANFIDEVATDVSKKLSKTVSTVVTFALLSLAVEGALGVGPIAARLGDGDWMRNAAEIVRRQIDELKQ